VAAAGIEKPAALVATKLDEASNGDLERLATVFPDLETVGVSVLDDASLDVLRDLVWRLTGLLRVFLRHGKEIEDEPVALHPGATVVDVADTIHHELAAACQGAHVWGPSARFDGQRVGRDHPVEDGDVVEIVS
jgi:ribosome-interacting GTPase 1